MIESYMLRICEKYQVKKVAKFTLEEVTRERDQELSGLGKKARSIQDVKTDILPLLKEERLIEMVTDQEFKLTRKGIDYCVSKKKKGLE
jgi:hypothetical protein